jgi:hypothetical protein
MFMNRVGDFGPWYMLLNSKPIPIAKPIPKPLSMPIPMPGKYK